MGVNIEAKQYQLYAPSLQEIKEVESEMYLSDRQNKDNGSYSLKSQNSQEMTIFKKSQDDGSEISIKQNPGFAYRSYSKEKLDKFELEKQLTSKLKCQFENQIQEYKKEISVARQQMEFKAL